MSFEIIIKTDCAAAAADDGVVLSVHAQTTIQTVKNLWSAAHRDQPWNNEWGLYGREKLLLDWKTLQELGIFHQTQLQMKRLALKQHSAAAIVTYECGNCHQSVFLGLGDDISCKTCGSVIVYKKNSTQPRLYQAQ